MMPANLTYIQATARGPLPDRPGAWENFSEQVDRAAEELRELRQDFGDHQDAIRIALRRFAFLTTPGNRPSNDDLLEIHATSVALLRASS